MVVSVAADGLAVAAHVRAAHAVGLRLALVAGGATQPGETAAHLAGGRLAAMVVLARRLTTAIALLFRAGGEARARHSAGVAAIEPGLALGLDAVAPAVAREAAWGGALAWAVGHHRVLLDAL